MDSVIDEKFALEDLLDPGVLKELCEAYSRCFNLGIVILDDQAKEYINVCPTFKFCKAMNRTDAKEKCEDTRRRLYRHPIEGSQVLQLKTPCGTRYALFALTNQLETVGRVVVGPFRDPQMPPDKIAQMFGETAGNPIGVKEVEEIPSFGQDKLKLAISLLAKTLNGFLFINAKRLITTRLHLESIYSSREDIFNQVELHRTGTKDDKEEIERLKDLF